MISPVFAQETHTVKRVIDGDTLEFENGEKVSLIGIDCPEMDTPEGREAKLLLDVMELEGKPIKLEYDVQKRDKYDRILAYAWFASLELNNFKIGDDGLVEFTEIGTFLIARENFDDELFSYKNKPVFLNAYIVQKGYASPMTVSPNVKYAELFEKLYQEARENKRGLWKNE